ncbi:D-alanyl-D-alanine carboxypeptidase [Candidatus Saccharibacteria bacterium]|nr:D-alanyl-D-alanine carboxypeptidase [Candidatus Saccharibacteria bacterium]
MRRKFSFGKVLALILVIFVIITGYKMATLDTTTNLVRTYELPKFVKISDLPESGFRQMAVAVDGAVIYEKNNSGVIAQPTASTTKMILSLAVLEKMPLATGEKGPAITISAEDYDRYKWYVANNGSVTAVVAGEEISEYDALMSVMLASSNNMADTLAIWAFGSLEGYREYASKMLNNWGLSETVLGSDASGYNAGTASSAKELALIGQKVLENPVLAEIVGTKEYTVPVAGTITNTNKLLGQNDVVGVKTGYIGEESGYCLVSAYVYEGHNVTVALLGAPSREESFETSRTAILKLQEELVLSKVVSAGQEVGYYENWWGGKVPVYANGDLEILGWKGANSKIELNGSDLQVEVNGIIGVASVKTEREVRNKPSLWERFLRAWGMK